MDGTRLRRINTAKEVRSSAFALSFAIISQSFTNSSFLRETVIFLRAIDRPTMDDGVHFIRSYVVREIEKEKKMGKYRKASTYTSSR